MKTDIRPPLKKVLMTCLKESGKILQRGFRKRIQVRMKGPINPVTEIDIAAEKKIVGIIRKNFPTHHIVTEEDLSFQGSAPTRWIIDPLDGTTNYAHGIALCCVSIGVEHEGKMVLGGVYNPMMGELFFAELGKGATLNGKRIQVSKTSRLIDSLLVTGFPYNRELGTAYYMKFFSALTETSLGIRRLGAAALDLAYVACGRFDAFWESNLKPWDVAAGMLLVTEAGGSVTDFKNQPFQVDHPQQMLASNSAIHSETISIFKSIL